MKHTSESGEGQIYVPFINMILAILCIGLVLIFQSSSNLAGAYGLAVTGTMVTTSIVFFYVTRTTWKWHPFWSWAVLILFLSFDLPFFFANLLKFFDGGWIPVAVGIVFFVVMTLWKIGRSLLAKHFSNSPVLDDFIKNIDEHVKYRVPGTAMFLASSAIGVPPVLMRIVTPFQTLHERVILLTITSENVPYFCKDEEQSKRVDVLEIGAGFYRVILRYGFMERPDVPTMLAPAFKKLNLEYRAEEVLYVLGQETFVELNTGSMPRLQQAIFAFLSRNSRNATHYFGLPPEQVIELGTQIDL